MIFSDTPCYKCIERHTGCHSNCDKYKQFREKLDADKQFKRKARMSEKKFYPPRRK